MFCYQCEQTSHANGIDGCASAIGNCGKDAQTSDLQDLLIYAVKGIAQYAKRARNLGVSNKRADEFILYAMFTTLTNVNFNPARFTSMLAEAAEIRAELQKAYADAAAAKGVAVETLSGPAAWNIPADSNELLAQAEMASIKAGEAEAGEDVIGLRALILYGAKGVCAYAYHALMLDQQSDEVYAGIEDALDFLASDPTDADALVAQALGLGNLNLTVMAMLDAGNTGKYGTPEPSSVRISPVAGKAILVSGHDMADLAALLKQTEGTGINIYTHGEMLPAHSYPELKKYSHLAGNYGGAWQDQQTEFANFPGPILMTSNCIIEPAASYRRRIFTAGPVGWPGLRHIENHDFSTLIQAANAMPGFAVDSEEKTITTGFGRDAVLGVADTVIGAVKSGAIKHFFLVGGCDGAASGRNYYSDLVEQTPKDTVILTLGCAKYRFNKQDLGDIGGIPRLLDMGQCNDSYSAIQVAVALANAFECEVNDLPLSLFVSWFEQKAAAVLLTLLALNIKGIHLGPTLPAFISPAVLNILVENFDIKANSTPEADLAEVLAA
ncbi:hydroxylamine reductase [Mariprofundus micogutta]|uniref:Hydroxylamine reductase n=1 Tax=Mariprofundus micogutta TaxID=1921010 RepID=A0A1L8CNQ9_9PROT|nr:hydroxylamine reductase [Mariprofundus micogutta]GAV20562.1 hydroxylamine reductase [Mariprofundus micogutta]